MNHLKTIAKLLAENHSLRNECAAQKREFERANLDLHRRLCLIAALSNRLTRFYKPLTRGVRNLKPKHRH